VGGAGRVALDARLADLLPGLRPLYCLDGVLGLITGSGYLDLGIVVNGVLDLPLVTRILMNLPHIAIGGFAALAGYVLARRWAPAAAHG
jgi:hypothetical protein